MTTYHFFFIIIINHDSYLVPSVVGRFQGNYRHYISDICSLQASELKTSYNVPPSVHLRLCCAPAEAHVV